ncbi:MAG: LicD family protein [Rhabdochlamydiaceae bacterium]|nr:LicD family protein [Rhabdochlamydiaceae bacterium]
MKNKILLLGFIACLFSLKAEEVEVATPPRSFVREFLMPIGMPVVVFWHQMKDNLFLNYARQDAEGLEALGDWILTPYRYLLGGSDVIASSSHPSIVPSCKYHKQDGLKMTLSVLTLPFSTALGSVVKGTSLLFDKPKAAYYDLKKWRESFQFTSQNPHYLQQGIKALFCHEEAMSLNYARPSELSKTHQIEIEVFKEICELLKKHDIVFWLDCGSALGAYRYQGMIPWDDDIDISIVSNDHHNVRKLLESLDPEKYQVQDWSSHLYPCTFIKFYIKKTKTLIDIYHYNLDAESQTATYFYTYQDTPLPKKWKRFEEVMTKPIPYSVLFPLKHAKFDGIDVWVPHNLEEFLHQKYGENLSPVMIWDEASQTYLKVMNHPYWHLFD